MASVGDRLVTRIELTTKDGTAAFSLYKNTVFLLSLFFLCVRWPSQIYWRRSGAHWLPYDLLLAYGSAAGLDTSYSLAKSTTCGSVLTPPGWGSVNVSQFAHHPPKLSDSYREKRGGSFTTVEWSWYFGIMEILTDWWGSRRVPVYFHLFPPLAPWQYRTPHHHCLHFQLKKMYPDAQLKLPGKKLFGNLDPDFIRQRREGLHDFIQKIIIHPRISAM